VGGLATAVRASASWSARGERPLRLLPPAAPAPEPAGPSLLERTLELAVLEEAIRRVAASEGSVIVLEAAAGLGKTALLDHAARVAAHAGCIVRRAAPAAPERDFPFGVVRSLLEGPLRGRPRPGRRRRSCSVPRSRTTSPASPSRTASCGCPPRSLGSAGWS